jgi:hypothetical protein
MFLRAFTMVPSPATLVAQNIAGLLHVPRATACSISQEFYSWSVAAAIAKLLDVLATSNPANATSLMQQLS